MLYPTTKTGTMTHCDGKVQWFLKGCKILCIVCLPLKWLKNSKKPKITLTNNDCKDTNYSLLSTKHHHCDHNYTCPTIEL